MAIHLAEPLRLLPVLVAVLCLAGALAAFLANPAYAQGDPAAQAPSNLTAQIVDGGFWRGVSLSWSIPSEDVNAVTGYQILRGQTASTVGVLRDDTGSSSWTSYTDTTATRPGTTYVYQVKARRASALSDASNQASVTPAQTCTGEQFNATPVDVPVSAVPIIVESTTADYFVLFVRPNADGALYVPVSVTRGTAGTTTLTEQLVALPATHYRVEKYPVDDPADVDGDCISDIAELDALGRLNPLNRAPEIAQRNGAVAIPDRATFEALSYQGSSVLIDTHLTDLEFVKFYIYYRNSGRPAVYFMNTVTHRSHPHFYAAVQFEWTGVMRGEIVYHPKVAASEGTLGVYRFEFEPNDAYSFEAVQSAYEVLAASMPLLEDNFAYYPMPARASALQQREDAV